MHADAPYSCSPHRHLSLKHFWPACLPALPVLCARRCITTPSTQAGHPRSHQHTPAHSCWAVKRSCSTMARGPHRPVSVEPQQQLGLSHERQCRGGSLGRRTACSAAQQRQHQQPASTRPCEASTGCCCCCCKHHPSSRRCHAASTPCPAAAAADHSIPARGATGPCLGSSAVTSAQPCGGHVQRLLRGAQPSQHGVISTLSTSQGPARRPAHPCGTCQQQHCSCRGGCCCCYCCHTPHDSSRSRARVCRRHQPLGSAAGAGAAACQPALGQHAAPKQQQQQQQ